MPVQRGPWIMVREACKNCLGTGKVENPSVSLRTAAAPREISCAVCGGTGRGPELWITLDDLSKRLRSPDS